MINDALCVCFGIILLIVFFILAINYTLNIVSFNIELLSDIATEMTASFFIAALCFSVVVLTQHYARFYFVKAAIHELKGQKFFIYESNIYEVEPSISSVKIKVIPEQAQCFGLFSVTKKAFFICQ